MLHLRVAPQDPTGLTMQVDRAIEPFSALSVDARHNITYYWSLTTASFNPVARQTGRWWFHFFNCHLNAV